MYELFLYDNNVFLILIYLFDNLFVDMFLNYRYFQLFMKCLCKKFGDKVCFYMCGEYGDKYGCLYYYVIMFNLDILDKLYYGDFKGIFIYISEIIDCFWMFGQCWIGDVIFEFVVYVVCYVMKKIIGDVVVEYYKYVDLDGVVYFIVFEFCQMFCCFGIGVFWFEKFQMDVFLNDYVVVCGVKCKLLCFYDNIFKCVDEYEFGLIKSDCVKDLCKDNFVCRFVDKEKCVIFCIECFVCDII